MVAARDGEVEVARGEREQLLWELGTAEQARDLLKELERRLKGRERRDPEQLLARLDRLAGSLPDGHNVRLLIESAAGSARAHGSGRAGSAVSRSRSVVEGRISWLGGVLSRLDAFSQMDA